MRPSPPGPPSQGPSPHPPPMMSQQPQVSTAFRAWTGNVLKGFQDTRRLSFSCGCISPGCFSFQTTKVVFSTLVFAARWTPCRENLCNIWVRSCSRTTTMTWNFARKNSTHKKLPAVARLSCWCPTKLSFILLRNGKCSCISCSVSVSLTGHREQPAEITKSRRCVLTKTYVLSARMSFWWRWLAALPCTSYPLFTMERLLQLFNLASRTFLPTIPH